MKTTTKLFLAASLALTGFVRAEDWPQYRGPQGDGIVREQNLLTEWPAEGPKKLWSVKTGTGHASPVVVANKVYLFTRDEDKDEEVLTAYEAADGKQLWQQSYKGGYNAKSDPTWHGARATPVVEGDKIYTYGGSGDLYGRAVADGKELWHINVLKDTKAKELEWAQASSPLIVGDLIYVQNGIGGGVPVAVAVNKADGKIAWQSEAKGGAESKQKMKGGYGGGYAQPVLATVGGKPQLVILGGEAVYGMDPATGKTLWQEEWQTSYDVNATTPIYKEPNLFISTGYGHGCMMLELSAAGAKKLWESKALASKYPQVILDRDALYGNSEGILKCIHWPDGKELWQVKEAAERLGPGGSLVRFGDYLITLSERGKLTLAKATPEAYKKISQVKEITPGKNIWSTPTISNGRLFIKGVDELICLSIVGGPT